MFESLAESMTSLLCDLSLEKAADNIEDKLDRKQLSNEIRKQITRYENEILPGLDGCKQPLSAASGAAFPGQSGPY